MFLWPETVKRNINGQGIRKDVRANHWDVGVRRYSAIEASTNMASVFEVQKES